MSQTILAQSPASIQSTTKKVYEYALTVIDPQDNDTHKLTAAFTFIPSPHDWQQWLSGWCSCGYQLQSQPQLIRTI